MASAIPIEHINYAWLIPQQLGLVHLSRLDCGELDWREELLDASRAELGERSCMSRLLIPAARPALLPFAAAPEATRPMLLMVASIMHYRDMLHCTITSSCPT